MSAKCSQKNAFQLFAIEIFAGTGRLTASLRQLGLKDSFGVDHIMSNHLAAPILQLDLLKPECLAFVEKIIREEACVYVHFAPPCGTFSAARKRRLAPAVLDRLASDGITPPQILRSEAFPMGLPNLRGLDAMKVHLANQLYSATNRLVKLALSLNIRVSIENPTNSLFKDGPNGRLIRKLPWLHEQFSQLHDGRRKRQANSLVVQ